MKKEWQTRTLEQVCQFQSGLWKGENPPFVKVGVIRNTNFTKEGTLNDSDIAYLDVEVKKYEKRRLQFGDIILEKSGGGPKQPVGRVALFDMKEGDYSFSNFTASIRVQDPDELDFRFVHRFLHWTYVAGVTERMQSNSTGIRNLDGEAYKAIEISFPPLDEQKRIVAKLDEAFVGLAKAKENAEKNLQNARALFESHLDSVFTQRGPGWKMEKLDVLTELARGHNPPKSKFIREQKPGYVRFYQIRDGGSDDYACYVPDTPQLHKMKKDDIMMVAYRHVGRAFRGVEGAFNVALCKISNARRDILDDDYLFHLIPSQYVKGELLKRSERSLIPSMSIEHLRELRIPLPPLREQQHIVKLINSLSKETQRLTRIYEQKLEALESLKKSILHEAFSGNL